MDMHSARSAPSAAFAPSSTDVSGLKTTPAPSPNERASAIARGGSSQTSTWNTRAPAATSSAIWSPRREKSAAYSDGSTSVGRAHSCQPILVTLIERLVESRGVGADAEREKRLAAQAAA